MEHIERSHPLRVTLSQIVIDGNHVHALMRESIEEYWQSSHQCFTLTSCHLGNLTAMQHHATDKLHIVVHHIPYVLIATSSPAVIVYCLVAIYFHEVESAICCQVAIHLCSSYHDLFVLRETASSTFHDSKGLWQNLTKYIFVSSLDIFLDMINLVIYFFAFIYLQFFDICFQL